MGILTQKIYLQLVLFKVYLSFNDKKYVNMLDASDALEWHERCGKNIKYSVKNHTGYNRYQMQQAWKIENILIYFYNRYQVQQE